MKYVTVQGDMWDSIAYKIYGDVNHTDVLISSNPQHRYIYVFSSGIELEVPDIEEKSTVSGLPPWKSANG